MADVDGVGTLDRPMNNGVLTLLLHPWIYFERIKGMKVFVFFKSFLKRRNCCSRLTTNKTNTANNYEYLMIFSFSNCRYNNQMVID